MLSSRIAHLLSVALLSLLAGEACSSSEGGAGTSGTSQGAGGTSSAGTGGTSSAGAGGSAGSAGTAGSAGSAGAGASASCALPIEAELTTPFDPVQAEFDGASVTIVRCGRPPWDTEEVHEHAYYLHVPTTQRLRFTYEPDTESGVELVLRQGCGSDPTADLTCRSWEGNTLSAELAPGEYGLIVRGGMAATSYSLRVDVIGDEDNDACIAAMPVTAGVRVEGENTWGADLTAVACGADPVRALWYSTTIPPRSRIAMQEGAPTVFSSCAELDGCVCAQAPCQGGDRYLNATTEPMDLLFVVLQSCDNPPACTGRDEPFGLDFEFVPIAEGAICSEAIEMLPSVTYVTDMAVAGDAAECWAGNITPARGIFHRLTIPPHTQASLDVTSDPSGTPARVSLFESCGADPCALAGDPNALSNPSDAPLDRIVLLGGDWLVYNGQHWVADPVPDVHGISVTLAPLATASSMRAGAELHHAAGVQIPSAISQTDGVAWSD